MVARFYKLSLYLFSPRSTPFGLALDEPLLSGHLCKNALSRSRFFKLSLEHRQGARDLLPHLGLVISSAESFFNLLVSMRPSKWGVSAVLVAGEALSCGISLLGNQIPLLGLQQDRKLHSQPLHQLFAAVKRRIFHFLASTKENALDCNDLSNLQLVVLYHIVFQLLTPKLAGVK